MPHRLVLLDSLRSLARGHPLLEPDTDKPLACLIHLEGAPEVHIVLDTLKKERWIQPGPKQHGLNTWIITEKGRDVLKDGEAWYKNLMWIQIALGRLGLPYTIEDTTPSAQKT